MALFRSRPRTKVQRNSTSYAGERDEVTPGFVKLQTDLARKYGVSAGRVYELASIRRQYPQMPH